MITGHLAISGENQLSARNNIKNKEPLYLVPYFLFFYFMQYIFVLIRMHDITTYVELYKNIY